MRYESEIIKEIIDTRGHEKSSSHYESECIESWIEEAKGSYPNLGDYQSEWLNSINKNEGGHTLVNLQQKGTWTINGSGSNQNASYSSALPTSILKPSTKYYVKFNKDISSICKQFYFVQSTDIIIPLTTHSTGAYGIITTPSTLDDKTTPIHIYPKDETTLTLEQLTDLYVMIIEYVEGMENWNIPYFEGTQTVDLETEE